MRGYVLLLMSTSMRTNPKIYWGLGVILLLVFLFYPWTFTAAPEMRVLILDENGNVAPGAVVQEKWEYKRIGSQEHREVFRAGKDGYAIFPKQTDRIPLIILIPSIAREIVHLPHGYGYGSVFTIFAYGKDQFVWAYIPLSSYEPIPRELRLKRQDEIRFPNDGKWP